MRTTRITVVDGRAKLKKPQPLNWLWQVWQSMTNSQDNAFYPITGVAPRERLRESGQTENPRFHRNRG